MFGQTVAQPLSELAPANTTRNTATAISRENSIMQLLSSMRQVELSPSGRGRQAQSLDAPIQSHGRRRRNPNRRKIPPRSSDRRSPRHCPVCALHWFTHLEQSARRLGLSSGCSNSATIVGALFLALVLLAEVNGAAAREASEFCRDRGTDDTLRPLPKSLVRAAKQIFGLYRMPDQQVRRSTVFRCAGGHMLLCNYGANLPCGKANTDRHPSGAEAWCRDHPDAHFIPNAAIPWGSIYKWRCVAGTAAIARQVEEIDTRGFVARYWKPVH